jgi:hypothetical protein
VVDTFQISRRDMVASERRRFSLPPGCGLSEEQALARFYEVAAAYVEGRVEFARFVQDVDFRRPEVVKGAKTLGHYRLSLAFEPARPESPEKPIITADGRYETEVSWLKVGWIKKLTEVGLLKPTISVDCPPRPRLTFYQSMRPRHGKPDELLTEGGVSLASDVVAATVCGECKGTGTYVGLTEKSACKACGGKGKTSA